MYWLMLETNWLNVNLAYVKPEHIQMIERRKHTPSFEPCLIKNASYPKPKPIKLLAEYCYVTKLEHELTARYFTSFANGKESYQTMVFGNDMITVNSHNPKLYKVIAEAVKVADSKPHKEPYTKLRQTKMFWTCGKIYNSDTGNDEEVQESNCLFPIEWLEAHYQDHKDFEPTIELTVNEKSISFNGNYKTGCIKTWVKANKMAWE
jgi:hypothetical protein